LKVVGYPGVGVEGRKSTERNQQETDFHGGWMQGLNRNKDGNGKTTENGGGVAAVSGRCRERMPPGIGAAPTGSRCGGFRSSDRRGGSQYRCVHGWGKAGLSAIGATTSRNSRSGNNFIVEKTLCCVF